MSIWAFLIYGFSLALALVLVYLYHAPWYWHVLSVLAALAIGFSPSIGSWDGATRDLVYGFVVLFLLVWGLAEPFVHHFHRHWLRHA
jgi:antibiotic biosynthesis monooxygenase (ABM) superfamily enzyme